MYGVCYRCGEHDVDCATQQQHQLLLLLLLLAANSSGDSSHKHQVGDP